MSRRLADLAPRFRPLAVELIARCIEAGIPISIVTTRRTAEEQAAALAKGYSRVKHSKHQDGLAIDLAPFEVYQAHGPHRINWDAGRCPEAVKEPWATMGRIGESLGLRWGGRWHDPFDPGHFELADPVVSPPELWEAT